MREKAAPSISPSRIYLLKNVCARYSIEIADLITLAANGEIELCVPIPAGTRLYHYPAQWTLYLDIDIERFTDSSVPASEIPWIDAPIPAMLGTIAVMVPPESCSLINAYGVARNRLFRYAYRIAMAEKNPRLDPEYFPPGRVKLLHPQGLAFPIESTFSDGIHAESVPDGAYREELATDFKDEPFWPACASFAILLAHDKPKNVAATQLGTPIELLLNESSLHITGDELIHFLEDWYPTLYPESADTATQITGYPDTQIINVGRKTYPAPVKDFKIPPFAPKIVHELHQFNAQQWVDFKMRSDPDECKKQCDLSIKLLQQKLSTRSTSLTRSDANKVMAILRPLWASGRNVKDSDKSVRLATINSPFFEKIVIVINDLHAEGLIDSSGNITHAKTKPEGELQNLKADVFERLCSHRHIALSPTYLAPVATKIILGC